MAFSLLCAGPVWAAEQQSSHGPALEAGAPGRMVPKIDFRTAARSWVAAETGLALPLPGERVLSDQATGAKPAPAAASAAATGKRTPDWSTVPPNAPRTTRGHKIAAYTALAILTVASAVLVVREIGKEDPVLTPGTPVRIP
jgi:hypothetical protein